MMLGFQIFTFVGFIVFMVLCLVQFNSSIKSESKIQQVRKELDTCENKLKLLIKKTDLLKEDHIKKIDSLKDDYENQLKLHIEKIDSLKDDYENQLKLHIEKTDSIKMDYESKLSTLSEANASMKKTIGILSRFESNMTAIPYLAGIVADYRTIKIEMLAKQLNWGDSKERKKKVESLIVIRRTTKEMIEKAKVAEYQLAYLCNLYPFLKTF